MVTRALRPMIVLCGLIMAFAAAACSGDGQVQADPTATAGASATADPSDSAAPTTATTEPSTSTSVIGPSASTTKPRSGTSSAPGGGQPTIAGKPGPSNTGVRPGVALTVVNGDRTYSSAQTVENMDFHGFVTVTGTGVTFKNCIFRGGKSTSNHALLDAERGHDTVVQDSEFVPDYPSATFDGIWIGNGSVYRANVHGTTDGLKVYGNVLVQDSWIHDMKWFASDPNQGGGPTHNDGVQGLFHGSNFTLRHNNIDLSMVQDANATLQNSLPGAVLDGNWLDGGGCTLNFHEEFTSTLSVTAITNNRFGRHQAYAGCAILLSNHSSIVTLSGNVWDDTGQPIPKPQQHD